MPFGIKAKITSNIKPNKKGFSKSGVMPKILTQ